MLTVFFFNFDGRPIIFLKSQIYGQKEINTVGIMSNLNRFT